jgi:hypothetical protein
MERNTTGGTWNKLTPTFEMSPYNAQGCWRDAHDLLDTGCCPFWSNGTSAGQYFAEFVNIHTYSPPGLYHLGPL